MVVPVPVVTQTQCEKEDEEEEMGEQEKRGEGGGRPSAALMSLMEDSNMHYLEAEESREGGGMLLLPEGIIPTELHAEAADASHSGALGLVFLVEFTTASGEPLSAEPPKSAPEETWWPQCGTQPKRACWRSPFRWEADQGGRRSRRARARVSSPRDTHEL